MSQLQLVDSASNPTTPADGRVNLGIKNNALAWVDDAGTLHSIDGTGATLTLADGKVITFTGTGTATLQSTGTWTPVLNFGGATTGITYSAQSGQYTRIGNLVYVQVLITLSNKGSATGNATITGLPFSAGGITAGMNIRYYTALASMSAAPIGWIGTTTINLVQPGAAAVAALTDSNFTNTSRLDMWGIYYA